jgi:hypothetical protein
LRVLAKGTAWAGLCLKFIHSPIKPGALSPFTTIATALRAAAAETASDVELPDMVDSRTRHAVIYMAGSQCFTPCPL